MVEPVDDDHPFDHVGQHGDQRPLTDADRHNRVTSAASDRPVGVGEAGRRPETGDDQPGGARRLADLARRGGEVEARRVASGRWCGGSGHGSIISGPCDTPPAAGDCHRTLSQATSTLKAMSDIVAPPTDLTPVQEHVLSQLRDGPRPEFSAALRDDLALTLQEELAPVAAKLTEAGETLFVGKRQLAQIHACEANHVADLAAPFSWSVPTARGAVAHKAIELSVHRHGERSAAVLCEEAMGALAADDSSIGTFIDELPATDRALLESDATGFVDAFLGGWPPLRRSWAPVVEGRLRHNPYPDLIMLAGRPDLMLGAIDGLVARRLIVDFKSGRPSVSHRDDVRYYALLHTLRFGVPPFRVATYYLDSGELMAEDVTTDVLDATLARTVDGASILAELALGLRDPTITPGPTCGWCVQAPTCDGAKQWASRLDADI